MTVIAQRYALSAILGETVGARVYAARDLTLQRPVAVTVVPAASQRAAATVRRAHAAAARSHPNLLTVLDAGSSAEGAFVVTERLDAGTLADRLSDGPLRPREVVALLDGVLAALEALHEEQLAVGGFLPWQIRLGVDGIWALAVLPAGDGDATPLPLGGALPRHVRHVERSADAGADVTAAGLLGVAALTGTEPADPAQARVALASVEPEALRELVADAAAGGNHSAAELRRRLPGGAPEGLPATVALPAPQRHSPDVERATPGQRLRRMARALTASTRR